MSGFRAIAGVSSTLRSLLRDRMEQPVDVTIAPPDVTVAGATGRRVNLYLYQVSENAFLKNQEIPGQGHPADYGRPPLSLEFHYLMTTFSASETAADADLEAQQILGDAMRAFHEFPIITDSLHQGDDINLPRILDPSLVGEFEKIKITLQPLTIDDFSKLWAALPQVNFRRSVVYQVSAVQIDGRRLRRSVLPVRERHVYVLPFRTPVIEEIQRDPPFFASTGAIAEVGDTIVIRGRNLRADSTRVLLDTTSVAIAAPLDTEIRLTVPATLPAGLHSVQVVHDLLLDAEPGQPPVPHRGFESNVMPLLVIPQLSGVAPSPAARGTVVTATVAPAALARQRKALLVGDVEVQAEPPADIDAPPSATVDFRLPATTPTGVQLVRIRIDGAESRLTVNPITTAYDGPTLTVT